MGDFWDEVPCKYDPEPRWWRPGKYQKGYYVAPRQERTPRERRKLTKAERVHRKVRRKLSNRSKKRNRHPA